jgi:pSer/pThr/pTyr-binding forkhead associated (FHA) protein
MGRKDREGWKDDSDADSSSFRSGGAGSSLFGGVYREPRGTEPWDGAPAADGVFREGRPTTIPDTLQELYAILVVLNGPRRFDLHRIGQRKATIGRDSTDIVLEDSAVGRQHAVITVAGDDKSDAEFRILDRGADGLPSKTGTLVNRRHITEAVLHDRDHIQVGETQLLFVQIWPVSS